MLNHLQNRLHINYQIFSSIYSTHSMFLVKWSLLATSQLHNTLIDNHRQYRVLLQYLFITVTSKKIVA